MKVMVTGAAGQLGRCLAEHADQGRLPSGWIVHGFARHQLDISDAGAVNLAFRQVKPDVVINAAAWTAVDAAEQHVDQAMAVNALGAANVSAAATQHGARLFHISTDYVFDGTARYPIDEAAEPRALNVYGASKLAGEVAVRHEAPDAVVVRTSWLYSAYGANFLKTILRRGVQYGVLDVVDDQAGCPTSACDLADAIVHLAQRPDLAPGIYHYSGNDAMTWYGFARLIVDCASRHDAAWADVRVRPIVTRVQGASAHRPAYSVLSCEKIRATGIRLYGPQDRLQRLVASVLTAG